MSNKETWRKLAEPYKGKIVVWIEQATDPNLQSVNSRGVCFALTHDWIENYTKYLDDRSIFVNSFRENEGNRDDGTSIPLDYIEQQQLYQGQINTYNSTLNMVKSNKKELGTHAVKQLVTLLKQQQKDIYGQQASVTYHEDTTSIHEVLAGLPIHPCYVALSFRKGGGAGGHVVGFEFRPDHHVSENYPELYEYFDANLGLFAFPQRALMLEFFVKEVWKNVYATEYAGCSFVTAITGIGLGGFGQDQSLEQELQNL
jgi:hypothetical protein